MLVPDDRIEECREALFVFFVPLEQEVEEARRKRERLTKTRRDALSKQVREQLGRERAALIDLELSLREATELLGVLRVLDAAQLVRRARAMTRHLHPALQERNVRIVARRRQPVVLARELDLVPVQDARVLLRCRGVPDVLVAQPEQLDHRASAFRRRLRAAAAHAERDATGRIDDAVSL